MEGIDKERITRPAVVQNKTKLRGARTVVR